MIDREQTCCFSGHRPMKLPWGLRESDARCIQTKEWLHTQITALYQSGYRNFICGMAIGCDTYFAQEVSNLKSSDDYRDIRLIGAIPCATQSDHWNKTQKLAYQELLLSCDETKIFQDSYSSGCMMVRNRWMVDHSSVLISCYNGRPGGTMNTIAYAMREGLETIILDISAFE